MKPVLRKNELKGDTRKKTGTRWKRPSPSQVVSQNANTFASILNNDPGAAGKAYFLADNGTNTLRFQQNGTGFGGSGASLAGEGLVYETEAALTVMVDNGNGIAFFSSAAA